MRVFKSLSILMLMASLMLATSEKVSAIVAVPGSFQGGIENDENDGSTLDKLFDQNAFYYLQALQGSGSTTFTLVLDQEAATTVSSVTIWGYAYYQAGEVGPGGVVSIAVGDSPTGPFTEIGARDFGGDRATNPWTGGKGQRIDTTPTLARYIRIGGGWDFDNRIRIAEIQVNGRVAIYDYNPIHNPYESLPNPANVPQANVFDYGNPTSGIVRSLHNMADGRKGNAGVNPNPSPMTFDLDFGTSKSIAAIELAQYDTDGVYLPSTVTVKTSSLNERDNFDVTIGTFTFTSDDLVFDYNDGANDHFKTVITFPTAQAKQFFQIECSGNLGVEGDATRFRIGEVDYVEEGETPPPVTAANKWMLY